MFSEDFVIGGADQFSEQQDLKLSANADKAATGAECAEVPMRFDAFATQAQNGPASASARAPLQTKA